jgi:uncharacterized protein YhfF
MLPELESFSFGDSPEFADQLLELVLVGKKTATRWAASEGEKGVAVGKRWIVKDGQGRASAILETVELKRRRFGDAEATFAHDEGEATARSTIGGECTRPISPDAANTRRTWSFIASGLC